VAWLRRFLAGLSPSSSVFHSGSVLVIVGELRGTGTGFFSLLRFRPVSIVRRELHTHFINSFVCHVPNLTSAVVKHRLNITLSACSEQARHAISVCPNVAPRSFEGISCDEPAQVHLAPCSGCFTLWVAGVHAHKRCCLVLVPRRLDRCIFKGRASGRR
jgi:hypothetical protein